MSTRNLATTNKFQQDYHETTKKIQQDYQETMGKFWEDFPVIVPSAKISPRRLKMPQEAAKRPPRVLQDLPYKPKETSKRA